MQHTPYFRNCKEAGRALAPRLSEYEDRPEVLVVGVPRGGMAVAHQLAHALNVALDAFLVSAISAADNLSAPDSPGRLLVAVGSGGVQITDPEVARLFDIPHAGIEAMARREHDEIKRRELLYRKDRPRIELRGRTVIIVDEGAVTGAMLLNAVRLLRAHHPLRIIVGLPVAPADVCDKLRSAADDAACVCTPPVVTSVEVFAPPECAHCVPPRSWVQETKLYLRINMLGCRGDILS